MSLDEIALATTIETENRPRTFGFWLLAIGALSVAGTLVMFLFYTRPQVGATTMWTGGQTQFCVVGGLMIVVGALLRLAKRERPIWEDASSSPRTTT